MTNKVYLNVLIRIVIVFVFGMIASYFADNLRTFFGDSKCDSDFGCGVFIQDGFKWGYRHYLYSWMCIALFVLSAFKIAFYIDYNMNKK